MTTWPPVPVLQSVPQGLSGGFLPHRLRTCRRAPVIPSLSLLSVLVHHRPIRSVATSAAEPLHKALRESRNTATRWGGHSSCLASWLLYPLLRWTPCSGPVFGSARGPEGALDFPCWSQHAPLRIGHSGTYSIGCTQSTHLVKPQYHWCALVPHLGYTLHDAPLQPPRMETAWSLLHLGKSSAIPFALGEVGYGRLDPTDVSVADGAPPFVDHGKN